MSVPRGFGLNGKSTYKNITKPQEIWVNFTVNHADTGGLGVTSVKSNGYVEYVFMNTSQTPGSVNGYTNPNPQAGYALIKFKNNFNKFMGLLHWQTNVLTSTSTTSVTQHNAYVITSLGTTTLAQWQAAGLQQGLTPTVGQAFIAITTGSIGGSGTVGIPGVPAISQITVVGDPNQTIANSNIAQNGGALIMVQFGAATNSSTTTIVPTAPADGTIIGMQFEYDGSSVTIDGL